MPWKPPTNSKPQNNRSNSAKRGYDGKWRKVRKSYLIRNLMCVACGKPAEVVDHIIPHRGDETLRWDETNYQAMCKVCHDKKTRKYDNRPVYGY